MYTNNANSANLFSRKRLQFKPRDHYLNDGHYQDSLRTRKDTALQTLQKVNRLVKGKLVPRNRFPDILPRLLVKLLDSFSDDKTIREVACDICAILLAELNAAFNDQQIGFCTIFGYFDWLDMLRLKGAAGIAPPGFTYQNLDADRGLIGRVVRSRQAEYLEDVRSETKPDKFEAYLAGRGQRISLYAHPLMLDGGSLVAVLVIGQFHATEEGPALFARQDFAGHFDAIARHLATIYRHGILVVKSKLAKKYVDNERRFSALAREFAAEANRPVDPKKFMSEVAGEAFRLLNEGNTETPFYQNYFFFEYQEYSQRFVLRSFRKKKYQFTTFHKNSKKYKRYVQDGLVKSVEGQWGLVKGRGKQPCVVRYYDNKVEICEEYLDENWSPAGRGSAFVVPLFDEDKPLGLFVFVSRRQMRRYVDKPKFYTGPERRKSSQYHLKYFRSLQPIIAREYLRLKLEDKQITVARLGENILSALKKIILIENQDEVVDRLAEFAAESLNCEACAVYLAREPDQRLALSACEGFQSDSDAREQLEQFLNTGNDSEPMSLPVRILNERRQKLANSRDQFQALLTKNPHCETVFDLLPGKRVISYLGMPIADRGVIEVFNSRKHAFSRWSSFEDQDIITLRHICDAIATVLGRMEATRVRVESAKDEVTTELLLDVSHELKNPLFSSVIFIRQLKDLLSNGQAPENPAQMLRTLNLIERNTLKAQNILRRMQSLQSIAKTEGIEPVDLEEILQMVLQTNRAFCEDQKIRIDFQKQTDDAVVLGNEIQLNQVFTNLVENAIDAMPEGGTLSITLGESKHAIYVEISDTGKGIPGDIKERIFDPFVTTKSPDKGSGLGLTLSRRIVNQLDGQIRFDSAENQGTKFIVHLPKRKSIKNGRV